MNRFALLLIATLVACQQTPPKEAAKAAPAGPAPGTPEWKIQTAMSAGPAAISSNATIAELTPDGKMNTLREGTNGWMCMPDEPSTPMTDPGCFDKVWQEMFGAYMAKKPFKTQTAGLSYMLKGGQAASNTDPFKMAPDSGQQWLTGGPHVMLIVPDPAQLKNVPTEPGGAPWVMWKGTPYVHVMVPVQ
ncbi:MAG: hypothetical protein HY700_09495 [Gemmatimonadetes bacterium]|nr:hypothetical protein [Gemmatimonadota bacterium]